MLELILATTLSCPVIEIKNWTDVWNKRDIINMQVAQLGCKRIYGPEHCLTIFIKEAPLTYTALCKKKGTK